MDREPQSPVFQGLPHSPKERKKMKKFIKPVCILAVLSVFALIPAAGRKIDARAAGDVAINPSVFPDEHFRQYISENCDPNGDGVLSPSEIAAVEMLSCDYLGISNIIGVEHFTSLKELYCGSNQITQFDLTHNTQLEILECTENQLTWLDLSQNTKLTSVVCDLNKIASININNCTQLDCLVCNDNRLTMLLVNGCPALTNLTCNNNKLTSLNISNNPNLNNLFCHDNPIEYLDIYHNPVLLNAYKNGVMEKYDEFSAYYDDNAYICVTSTTTILSDAKGKNSVTVIFDDIPRNAWYINAVQFVYDRKIMAGMGRSFKADTPVTREQFTQILYNMQGQPAVSIPNPYPDVAYDGWYYHSVLWAREKNIANGKGDGTFGVGSEISRQEMATMLYKYAKLCGYNLAKDDGKIYQYPDAGLVSSWARDSMNWALTQGIMSGKGSGGDTSSYRLDPAGKATRGEAASMIKKLLEKNGK